MSGTDIYDFWFSCCWIEKSDYTEKSKKKVALFISVSDRKYGRILKSNYKLHKIIVAYMVLKMVVNDNQK